MKIHKNDHCAIMLIFQQKNTDVRGRGFDNSDTCEQGAKARACCGKKRQKSRHRDNVRGCPEMSSARGWVGGFEKS